MKNDFMKWMRLQLIIGMAVVAVILLTTGHEEGCSWVPFVIVKITALVLGGAAAWLAKRWQEKGLLKEVEEC